MQISSRAAYYATVYLGVEYGIGRWHFDRENADLYDNLEYRIMEYYMGDDVISYECFGKGAESEVSGNDKDAVEGVETWLVENILVVVNDSGEKKLPEEAAEKFRQWGDRFVEKYDGLNPADSADDVYPYWTNTDQKAVCQINLTKLTCKELPILLS